jgi:aspartate racemase
LVPEAEEQQHITELIYDIKRSREDINPENTRKVVSALRKRGAEVIILGCTELPIAFGMFDISSSYVDSLEVLAMSAIAYAGKEIRYEKINKGMK